MSKPLVLIETKNQVSTISLHRPEKRNAMIPEMLIELDHAFQSISKDTRAVVLIGEGKTFCAGFDLKLCAQDPSGETMRSLLSGLSQVVRTMRALHCPIVLGVHGAAVAGGCALLGGADIIIADQSAKLGYPVVKIGVSPAVSAAFMLASISPGDVRSRLIDTELISGSRAQEIGLVHEIVDTPEAVRERALKVSHDLAKKPGQGVQATKSWINEICEPITQHALSGLDTSLSLTGSIEEHERLSALWS